MQEAASTKFNLPKTTTYIIMPLAFTGKDKRFKDLTIAYQFLLAEIDTKNRAFKGPAKLTYEHFVQKFGMSRETVSAGLHTLIERGIIKSLGGSRYRLLLKVNRDDYIIIDDYLHKQLWNVGGVHKRLARSRIIVLELVHRHNLNEKASGIYDSSQARIGVAVGLPKSTAGDSVRELARIGLLALQKADEHVKDACKRGLTRYTVHPELLQVKRCKPEPPPDELQAVKELVKNLGKKSGKKARERAEQEAALAAQWNAETTAQHKAEHELEALEKQLMQDDVFRALKQRIEAYRDKHLKALFNDGVELAEELEAEAEKLRKELKAVLEAHGVPPGTFPHGHFYIV